MRKVVEKFGKCLDDCLDRWIIGCETTWNYKAHEKKQHAVSGTYQLNYQHSTHFLFLFLLYWQINYLRMSPLSHLIISRDWAQKKINIWKKWCSIFNGRESFSIYECLTHHFVLHCLKRTIEINNCRILHFSKSTLKSPSVETPFFLFRTHTGPFRH